MDVPPLSLPPRVPMAAGGGAGAQPSGAALPGLQRPLFQPAQATTPAPLSFLDGDRQRPPADESRPPIGFEHLAYTSGPAQLLHGPDDPPYVRGGIPTPPEAAKVLEAGLANFASQPWQQLVAYAAQQNGGLGNQTDGYLAFSHERGFVRFLNPNLTPEQNRRLAEASLQCGWSIDKMPSRSDEPVEQPNIQRWVDEFLTSYADQRAAFLADPVANPIQVKDGRTRYKLEFNAEASAVVSYSYKKHGGFRGFAERNLGTLAPILDIATLALGASGVGAPLAAGLQATKLGLTTAATGHLSAQQVVGSFASVAVPFGNLSPLQMSGLGAASALAAVVDRGGKFTASDLVGVAAPFIQGLPGGIVTDEIVRRGLGLFAQGIDGRQITAAAVFQALAPLIVGFPQGGGRAQAQATATALQNGAATMAGVANGIKPLFDSLGLDPDTRSTLYYGLGVLVDAIDNQRVDPARIHQVLAPWIERQLGSDASGLLGVAADYLQNGRIDSHVQAGVTLANLLS